MAARRTEQNSPGGLSISHNNLSGISAQALTCGFHGKRLEILVQRFIRRGVLIFSVKKTQRTSRIRNSSRGFFLFSTTPAIVKSSSSSARSDAFCARSIFPFVFHSVANRLSADCDCDGSPHKPEMADLGIFASSDPVALDQACYDAVVNADDPGKKGEGNRPVHFHGQQA